MNTVGIIGLGTLGTAIARGLHRALPDLAILSAARGSTLPAFVTSCDTNVDVAAWAHTLFLCVKPHQVLGVLNELSDVLTPQHEVVSTCTGVSLATLAAAVAPEIRVARAMPNLACEFNEGVTALAFGNAWLLDRDNVMAIFSAVGTTITLEERHFDAVTALTGCGPAYVCVIAEALSDAGVKAGLPRDIARGMAVQTLLGSTILLRSTNEHPAAIRDRVTTPGGCTIDALTELEAGGLRATLIAAVTTAAEKSRKLGAEMSIAGGRALTSVAGVCGRAPHAPV